MPLTRKENLTLPLIFGLAMARGQRLRRLPPIFYMIRSIAWTALSRIVLLCEATELVFYRCSEKQERGPTHEVTASLGAIQVDQALMTRTRTVKGEDRVSLDVEKHGY